MATSDVWEKTLSPAAERVVGRALIVGTVIGAVFGFALMVPEVIDYLRGIPIEDFDPGLWVAAALVGAASGAGCALSGATVWMATAQLLIRRVAERRILSVLASGAPILVLGWSWNPAISAVAALTGVIAALVAQPWVSRPAAPAPSTA